MKQWLIMAGIVFSLGMAAGKVQAQATSPGQTTCSLMVDQRSFASVPVTVTFQITTIQIIPGVTQYRMFYGDGVEELSNTNTFKHTYVQGGTYGAQGYVRDGQGNFIGGGPCHEVIAITVPVPSGSPAPPYPTTTPVPTVSYYPSPVPVKLPVAAPQTGPAEWLILGSTLSVAAGLGLLIWQKARSG